MKKTKEEDEDREEKTTSNINSVHFETEEEGKILLKKIREEIMTNTIRQEKKRDNRWLAIELQISSANYIRFSLPYSQFCIGSHRINETNNDDQRKKKKKSTCTIEIFIFVCLNFLRSVFNGCIIPF